MVITNVGKVVCAYCGSEEPEAIKGKVKCPNCGAVIQKLTVYPVNQHFDSRRAFAQDRRLAQPQ